MVEFVEFTATKYAEFTLISFQILGDGILSPSALAELVPPAIDNPSKGVVISGRGPVWLFCHLAHHYHPTAWVGTFAPSEGGAVVVARHSSSAPPLGAVVAAAAE